MKRVIQILMLVFMPGLLKASQGIIHYACVGDSILMRYIDENDQAFIMMGDQGLYYRGLDENHHWVEENDPLYLLNKKCLGVTNNNELIYIADSEYQNWDGNQAVLQKQTWEELKQTLQLVNENKSMYQQVINGVSDNGMIIGGVTAAVLVITGVTVYVKKHKKTQQKIKIKRLKNKCA